MDLALLPAVEQAALLASGEVSATELLEACRRRAEETEPVVNSLLALDWDRAGRRAAALDADPAVHRDSPLRGLVTAHKDLLDTAGVRTTYGSPVYADNVPTTDAPLVTAIAEAGAVAVGKTNTPEFGAGSHTFNPVHGVTRNPWDPTRSAGGSSGGAAAALACGSVSVADGSDLGGSLRNPASFCGVVGLRPSIGALPPGGPPDERIDMPINGPMGRCVADVDLLFSAMVGGSPPGPPPTVPRRPRALFSPDHGDLPVDAEVRGAMESAVDRLADAGWAVEVGDLAMAGVDSCFEVLRALAYSLMQPELVSDERVKATVRAEIATGLALDPEVVAARLDDVVRLRAGWEDRFKLLDVVITPTSQVPPFPVSEEWVESIEGVDMNTYTEWMRSCSRLTVTGAPSVSLPAGYTAEGLPIGLQLSGRRGSDRFLLALAAAAEEVLGRAPAPPLGTLAATDPATLPPGPEG